MEIYPSSLCRQNNFLRLLAAENYRFRKAGTPSPDGCSLLKRSTDQIMAAIAIFYQPDRPQVANDFGWCENCFFRLFDSHAGSLA